jgi:hypothetical protein
MFEYMIHLIMDYLMWLSEWDIEGDIDGNIEGNEYCSTIER